MFKLTRSKPKTPAAAPAPVPGPAPLMGGVDACEDRVISGWAAPGALDGTRLVIELWIDGQCQGQARADLYRPDLAASQIGDGRYAFAIELPPAFCDGQPHDCELRERDSGTALRGSPLTVRVGKPVVLSTVVTGRLDTCDTAGAQGWAAFIDGRGGPVTLEWLLDGQRGGSVVAEMLRTDLIAAGHGDGRHGFAIELPASAFDGEEHLIAVRSEADGLDLPGSPLHFCLTPFKLWQRADNRDEATRRALADRALGYLEGLPASALHADLMPQVRQLLEWLEGLPAGRLLKRARRQWQRLGAHRWAVHLADATRPNQLRVEVTDRWGGDEALSIELVEDEQVHAGGVSLPGARKPGQRLSLGFDLPASLLDDAVHAFNLRLQPGGLALGPVHVLLASPSAERNARATSDSLWAGTPGARQPRTPATAPARPLTAVQKARLKLDDADLDDSDTASGRARRITLMLDLAQAQVQAGDWADALAQIDQALALDAEHLGALAAGVRCLMTAGDDAAAATRLDRALALRPDERRLHTLRDQLAGRSRLHQVRTLAFYLPQFHPTPQNNEWWGEGFTEWHNVGGATPLFGGHLQPRRPTTLGYYDLRLPEAVNAQFALARRYGIDGFCYYYYWFEGKRILERPLDDLVAGRTGPFPFCICWANEDWTRAWDGATGEVLAAQNHSPEGDFKFIQDVAPMLRHPDYIRVDGKPMVLVYRADKLATPAATVERWREWCRQEGIGELHLCAVQSFGFHDPRPLGFDAAVEFPPHCPWDRYPEPPYLKQLDNLPGLVDGFAGKVYDYQAFAKAAMARPREPFTLHRTAMVAWDNTARRGKTAAVYHHFSTETFANWVLANARRAATEQVDAVCFVNAWNEWAEGSVMEPDTIFGHQILEDTRAVKQRANFDPGATYWRLGQPDFPEDRLAARQRVVLVGHDAFPSGAQTNLLNMARTLKRQLDIDVSVLLVEGGELLPEYERVAPTHVIGKHGDWRGPLQQRLRQWAALGACKAICNTVATGDVAELLQQEGYRVVGLVHELPTLIEASGLQPQCWRLADKADALVFASQVVADGFTHRFWPDPRKRLVAPQGIAFNRYHDERERMRALVREELGLAEGCQIVMGCGWGDTRKGIDLFVRLAGEVAADMPAGSVAFVWVGGVDAPLLPYLQADARRLGVEPLFRITGRSDDAPRYFIASDVFALTSREDPFPSVVMEAFDAGMPVLAFDGGGGYVDIVNADTGALLPYLDVSAMAQAALGYLRDAARRAAVGAHNHQQCRERYGYAPYMRKLLALLAGVPAEQVAAGLLKRQAWAGPGPAPRITAIVPNYNYARYLELRLQTVVHQTLPPCEIIVLDDASTDASVALVQAFAERSPIPITLVTTERNTGNPFVQWAKGLALATGDLVWIAEADDYCEPTLLETLARELVDDQVVMAWADSIMVDDAGHSQGAQYKDYYSRNYGSKWRTHFRMPGAALVDDCLFTENVVPNASAVLFRRAALGFDLAPLQKYRFSGDWWFWLMLARSGDVVYRADPLNYHRRHAKSVMGDVLRSGQALLPETIGFYQRLAQAAPDCVSPRSADMALQRLDQLYGMFPALQDDASRLDQHPAFGAAHAGLAGTLEGLLSARRPATAAGRSPAVLVLSTDVLGPGSSGLRLWSALAVRHLLQLVVLAAEPEADGVDGVAEWGLPEDTEATVIRPRPQALRNADTALRAELARALAAALPATPVPVTSHGLLAHCTLGALPAGRIDDWLLAADTEFDALLGRAPDVPGVDVPGLAGALGACSRASHLGANPPHAFARLAQLHGRPLDRLALALPAAGHRLAAPAAGGVAVLAVAGGVSASEWARVGQALQAASLRHGVPARLRLLAWGDTLAALQGLVADDDHLAVVALYQPPTALEPLADAALAWRASGGTAAAGAPALPTGLPRCQLPTLALPWPMGGADWADHAAAALDALLTSLAPHSPAATAPHGQRPATTPQPAAAR